MGSLCREFESLFSMFNPYICNIGMHQLIQRKPTNATSQKGSHLLLRALSRTGSLLHPLCGCLYVSQVYVHYIYICIYMYIYICIYIYISMSTYMYIHLLPYIYTSVCICVHTNVYSSGEQRQAGSLRHLFPLVSSLSFDSSLCL